MDTIYQGRHGEYKIVQYSHQGNPTQILVEYISGSWKGRRVPMSEATHNRIQENIEFSRKIAETSKREEMDIKLDLWWGKYPALYKSLWHETMTGETLLKELEKEYPDAANNVNEEALRW